MRRKRNKHKHEEEQNARENLFRMRQTMIWKLMLFVLTIIIISGFLTALLGIVFLVVFGWLPAIIAIRLNPYIFILILLCTCSLISIPLSVIFGKYYLRPIKSLISATKEVKKGNFEVRVSSQSSDSVARSEMDALIDNFNDMVRELGGIEMFRNDFINNFSHEFKTPIVSIRGFAKELQFGDLTDAQRVEYAKIIAEESDRLAKLSTSILELSKLENQQIVSDKTEFYLDEQIRQCILLHEADWSSKQIDMIPELDEVRIVGNEEMLNRVWGNLISNAIKFTPDGGIVTVRLTADEKNATVTVSDTGIGMSEEVKNHIFEKFFQGDKSHAHKGYGIGLTVVLRVVELCGGTVTVDSRPDEGSTFTVTLPRGN